VILDVRGRWDDGREAEEILVPANRGEFAGVDQRGANRGEVDADSAPAQVEHRRVDDPVAVRVEVAPLDDVGDEVDPVRIEEAAGEHVALGLG
jgi:hypothetical protein